MSKKKNRALVPVGGISIMAAFAIICLVVFAVLSLTTAISNRNISEAYAESIMSYYEADTQAEEIRGEIAGVIQGAEKKNPDKSGSAQTSTSGAVAASAPAITSAAVELPAKSLFTKKDSLKDVKISVKDNIMTFKYSCKINEEKRLDVVLRYNGKTLTTESWKTVALTDWSADDDMDVWSGEMQESEL